MATIGVNWTPLVLLALCAMTGALALFFVLTLIQITVLGSCTTAPVYSRLSTFRVDRARGLALALAACAPAIVAAALIPSFAGFVETHGWRAGYRALALYTAMGGAIALLMIPAGSDRAGTIKTSAPVKRDYRAIVRNRAFQLIVLGFVLTNQIGRAHV